MTHSYDMYPDNLGRGPEEPFRLRASLEELRMLRSRGVEVDDADYWADERLARDVRSAERGTSQDLSKVTGQVAVTLSLDSRG